MAGLSCLQLVAYCYCKPATCMQELFISQELLLCKLSAISYYYVYIELPTWVQ